MNQATSIVSAVQQAVHSTGLTATGLTDLLMQVDAEGSASAKARIKVILDGLCNLPLQDGRKILTETAKNAKGTPTEATVKARVSECRQLYGAARLIEGFRKGVTDAGMGWSSSVSRARAELEANNLKANGDRLKSKEEVALEKANATFDKIVSEQLQGVDRTDADKVAEAAAHASEVADSLGATNTQIAAHAANIVKNKGMAYAVALSDVIVALYDATVAEMDEVEPEQAQAQA